jgi:Alr-MurF fusion protein
MEYKISEISDAIGGQLFLNKECNVSHAFIDSRNILPLEKSIFFAIKGKRNDGHLYINDLTNSGVKNFVIEEFNEQFAKSKKCNYILVPNVLNAFQKFAAWHRSHFQLEVLAITGSNGKTIVKEWLFHLLAGKKNIVRSPKSYNSQVGVPLSVLLLDKYCQLGIFEAGISEPGEMLNLENIIKPTIGIFTNIGDAHQENFSDYAQKTKEKFQLFNNCKIFIYCSDYQVIEEQIIDFASKHDINLFSWSNKKAANLKIDIIEIKNNHSLIIGTFEKRQIQVEIPYSDKASVENAIHALAFLLANQLFDAGIKERFSTLPSVGMRLEMMHGINQCTIINDSYNSDLNSIKIAMDVLKRQNQHKKKCLILSDVLQSGENDEELYKNLEKLVKSSGIQKFIGIGPKISEFYPKSKFNLKFFANTKAFLKSNEIKQFSNEAILIKGARDFKFEDISEALQQRTHRTVLEIKLEAIESNLNYFRALLQPKTKIMVMVKAFSYGSGSFEIASFLEHQRVDYLGVAFADEGVALRNGGIKLPIIVMNPEEGSYENIINYGLEPEIYSFRSLERFNDLLEQYNQQTYPIHLKIDTGMKRLGFLPSEIELLVKTLKKYVRLKPRSIFSHLVASEDSQFDDFTNEQIDLFSENADKIQKIYNHQIIRHILNSSGIERFPNGQFEMVRLGIGLYGVSSRKNIKLQNTSTLKSHITQIKWVEKHESIGYGRRGILGRDSKIATIPIGYADGLNRRLGNRVGRVYINGSFALIIGNICMDLCMVDITDIEANEGDEVIFFGSEIPIGEIAEKVGTIPYEILTGISQRVKRVYIQ